MKKSIAVIFLVFGALACSESGSNNSNSETVQKALIKAPELNADSVYSFVKAQVDFGPRVPNSKAHQDAADYFVDKFKSYGAKVVIQEFEDQNYEGKTLKLKNIIASFNPAVKKRILLAAHWDTRQFADKDNENVYAKLDGANDGASGVAVLLEVARVISANEGPNVGVDIILFDGEDGGEHEDMASVPFTGGKESWWCLGSQYWSKNKHVGNYTAFYGILLDMVGASGATFYQDTISKRNAQRIVDKVWGNAKQLGYGKFFIDKPGLELTDDHLFVNKYARIPMIDIIDMRKGTAFVPEHHTQNDTMDAIDKNTLKAVGEVLLSVLYNE